MIDFGLTNEYMIYDRLDQEEVFLLLLWRIFYDSLLCEIKRHEQLCGYRLNLKFFTKSSRANPKGGKTFFFVAGAFVDDTIWVENCLVATQYILDIASEFFLINNIAINTDKTIIIPINQEARKALYHLELYSLRTFEQVLTENLLAGLVVFTNAGGILSELFEHRAMELQATSWMPWHPLQVLIKLLINFMNCFLAGVTHALKLCNLLLSGDLSDVFQVRNDIAVLDVLGFESYLDMVKSLKKYDIVFANQLLNRHGTFKDHSGVVRNEYANFYANATITSKSFLSFVVPCCFFNVEGRPVFRNACHIAKKLFNAVYSVGWEAKYVGSIISVDLCDCFDKARIFCVWHSNGKIKSDYINTASVTLWSYFIKALHYCLPVAKKKKLYNLNYPSIACIQCGLVEDFDHVFFCTYDVNIWKTLLFNTTLE
ncbi:hypothetical protein G9A89_006720 [Geosiphon pyriformis]|nr:hypothetical protein G9A89_006720 [Geosiphon pyriformis]